MSGAFPRLPSDVVLGVIWNFRTTTPFQRARQASTSTNATTTVMYRVQAKGMGNRDSAAMMTAVNAYRATLGLPALPEIQIDTNTLYTFDLRVSKSHPTGGGRKVKLIGQVLNALGRSNLGGVGSAYQSSARGDRRGQILTAQARQQGEVAVRFVW